jgi:hypothetical protein
MRLLSDLMKMVDTSGAFGTRPRTQPVVIWLFGESGVGKSGMSWPLAVDLNNMFVANKTEAREFSKNIYMRNVEQEFWDNYQGQNVVIYDDFGQRVDSTGNPNEEFMELIRTANIAPYPLHMAHLEDKRKTRFTSKVLILTSNVLEQSVNSLTFPDAFRRRIDLCARVTNKEHYTKQGFSASTGKTVLRLDKEKVRKETGSIISTSVYEIELVDPESKCSIETGLSYEEFLERAVEKARDAFDSSKQMNEFLENYAETRFKNLEEVHTVSAEMQMELPENTTCFEYDFLNGKTSEEIYELCDYLRIVKADNPTKPITRNDLLFELFNIFLELEDMEDKLKEFDDWKLQYLYDNYLLRETKIEKRLKKAKEYGMHQVLSWADKCKAYCTEHPFIVASTIIGTISTMFLACKFWSKIVGKPREVKQMSEIKVNDNVKILAHNGESARDLTSFSQSQLAELLPQIAGDFMLGTTTALILRQPYPLVLGFLAGLQKPLTVYVTNKLFNYHGNTVEMIPVVESKTQLVQVEAKASSDPTTFKNRTLVLEAQTSGDPTTMKPKVVVLEANPSGDQVTMKPPKVYLESAEMVPADMQMWKDQTAQNLITNRIFSNLYKISKVKKGGVDPLLRGIFIRNNIMLVPGHLCGFLNETDEIELRNSFDVSFRLPWSKVRKMPVLDFQGEAKEAALLMMPSYVSAHSDIVKHFSDGASMARYRRADTCLPLLRYSEKFQKLLMYILGTQEAKAKDRPLIISDAQKGEFMVREGLEYKAPTTAGDCGAPVIINETQVLRKIAGIHVAGAKDGTAYAESITQKDLERSLAKIDASMQIQVDYDKILVIPTNKEVPLNQEFSVELLDFCDLPGPKFLPLGKVAERIFEPGKTEIRPSLIYGKISSVLTKPAKLRDEFTDEGERIRIKHRNLAKCAMDTPYINDTLIERAFQQVKTKWLSNRDKKLARVLTWEECVKGSSDSEYLGPINRQSSPGFPWICLRKNGKPGKTGWFGDSEYILSPEVERAVDYRVDEARQGKRIPTVWIDTLKDERRPMAKVDAFKTRVFSNGPMDYTMAFRKYFLGFIAHLMENRIENEVSIGTNVYSQDWRKTARKLKRCGDKVIAGDFSTFDGTLNSCLMSRFVDLANEFYDDGPENATIRKVLFQDIYNSVHLCDGSLYMMTHSQPSGNPATTPLNCFINSMSLRICFEICAVEARSELRMRDFEKHVSIVSYGDDNVINFSDYVAPWFNMRTLTTAFSQLGMIYTDETKSETHNTPLWRRLEDVAYLKRNFRFDESKGVWEAPLSMDTILEMPNWCRGELDIEEGTKVNCENAIMELSMHSKTEFDKWTRMISRAFYNATGNQLNIDTYEGYFQRRYLDYYL